MAYFSNVDERYAGGFLSQHVDAYDAPNTINSLYRLAENTYGYGNLTDAYISADVDVYSLGSLTTGHYKLDVDEYNWDYSNFGYGSISNFSILNSYGGAVETSYNQFSDIEFTVEAPSIFYVEIEGLSSFSTSEYRVRYEKTGELSTVNSPAVFSGASYTGNLTVGSQITSDISYYDADGYSSATNSVGLLTSWYLQDSSGFLEYLGGDYVDSITLTADMVGKTLQFSKGFTDALNNLETSVRYTVGVVESSNSRPSITSSPITTVNEDSPYSYTITGTDPDGDILYTDLNSFILPSWLSLSDGVISGTPTNEDVGNHSITVAISDNAGGSDTQSFSIIVENTNDSPTGSVTISGTAIEGETLTAVTSTIGDEDGLGVFSYQWFIDGSVSSKEPSEVYTLTTDDVGASVSVSVNYIDGQGTAESLTSIPTSAVESVSEGESFSKSYLAQSERKQINLTSNSDVNALLFNDPYNYAWDTADNIITFSFHEDHRAGVWLDESAYVNFGSYVDQGVYEADKIILNSQQRDAAREALKEFSKYTDLQFVEVVEKDGQVGDIRFSGTEYYYPNANAWAVPIGFGSFSRAGDIWISEEMMSDNIWQVGKDYNYSTLVHEIGHALGLEHPHEGNLMSTINDYDKYTVMSYEIAEPSGYWENGEYFYYATHLMVYDIAALQHMYGANHDLNSSDTVYQFDPSVPFVEAIWDGGGIDLLDFSNFSIGSTINLVDGLYSSIGYQNWNYSNNLGIAFGCEIENVNGTSGSDTIFGNELGNEINGLAGDDTLTGGSGSDTFIFKPDFGSDIVTDFDTDVDALKFYDADDNLLSVSVLTETQNADGDVVLSVSDGSSVTLEGVSQYLLPSETVGAISATNSGSGSNMSLNFYVDPSLVADAVTSFDMVVSFDSDGAEYVSTDLGDFLGFPNVSGDTITLSGISLSGISTSDPLFTLNFTDLDTSANLVINITDVLVNNAALESSTLAIGGPEALDVSVSVASRSGAVLSDVVTSFNDGTDVTTATSSSGGVSTVAISSGSDVIVTASLDYDASSKSITSQDALDALRLSVGMDTQNGSSTAFDYIAADFNQDGRVTSEDALVILKNAVGLPTTEQAEWVFVDSNGAYSDVSRSSVSYEGGLTISDLSEAAEVSLTGILIGDVNDSYSGLIA